MQISEDGRITDNYMSQATPIAEPYTVDVPEETNIHVDPETGLIHTENEDGSLEISEHEDEQKESKSFSDNLAEILDDQELALIAGDLLDGIDADIQSRQEWEQNMADAIIQLGLRREQVSSLDMATVSKCRHPVLLEACQSFWAQFVGEFLPANGPCKIRQDGDSQDEQAQKLQDAFNHYLTVVATEYYPDTSRAGFRLGLSGGVVKKVYYDQIRERPVSEAVYLDDLIVSNDITDLQNAQRVSHRMHYLTQDVKRTQAAGVWLDCDLVPPEGSVSKIDETIGQVEGVNPNSERQEDRQHTIYECQTRLVIDSDKFSRTATKSGFPSPYLVTIDKDSQKILAIYRNWKEGDKFYKTQEQYVSWFYMPGLGWYPIGLAQILANSATTLTALWREIVDAGMFANFPGFLYEDAMGKQDSMTIRVNPGQGAPVKVPMGKNLAQSVVPMPYKDVSPTLLAMAEKLEAQAKELASAAQIPVGEGTANIPVGTVVAMIEQGTKVLQAIHKGLHNSQKRELELLRDLFIEHPEDLTKFNEDETEKQWTAEELKNHNLVPASDPNTPSSIHRIMQAMMLGSIVEKDTDLFDKKAVAKRVLQSIGIHNIDELWAKQQAQPQQDPSMAIKQQELQLKGQEQQRKAASDVANNQHRHADLLLRLQSEEADRQSEEKLKAMDVQMEQDRIAGDITKEHLGHVFNQQRPTYRG